MFYKTGVLRNFANFTRKTPVLKSLFNRVADFANFTGKTPALKSLFNRVADQETQTQMFSCGVHIMFKN